VCEILEHAGVAYAILGQEERCSGDPARRAGNEFLFQMTAAMNIETLNMYGVQKIVAACPHCFSTLKNEYPQLGGNYEVVHRYAAAQRTHRFRATETERKAAISGANASPITIPAIWVA
jgi:Fe-S oxidoreductase